MFLAADLSLSLPILKDGWHPEVLAIAPIPDTISAEKADLGKAGSRNWKTEAETLKGGNPIGTGGEELTGKEEGRMRRGWKTSNIQHPTSNIQWSGRGKDISGARA